MSKSKQLSGFLLISFFVLIINPLVVFGDLRFNFYKSTCPRAESIVLGIVANRTSADSSIPAALLRMHFHDCFVQGCDASILIDPSSTPQNTSEKDAGANDTVRGFELIDEVKQALEVACPKTVSCADIISLATRDAIALSNGPSFAIPTGRRDGLTSNPNNVNLPGAQVSVSQAQAIFKGKGMTSDEMVTLLGAHTIGVAHCNFFQERLSSFQGTKDPDPTMNKTLVNNLTTLCKLGANQFTFLDQGTGLGFDNQFYNQILSKNGVLQIDQRIADDNSTKGNVTSFATNGSLFSESFVLAIVKLSTVEVLVGNSGEIRTNCRAFNNKSTTPAPATPTTPTPTSATPTQTPATPTPAPASATPTPAPAPATPTPAPASATHTPAPATPTPAPATPTPATPTPAPASPSSQAPTSSSPSTIDNNGKARGLGKKSSKSFQEPRRSGRNNHRQKRGRGNGRGRF